MNPKRLYIGNLSYKTTSDSLKQAFGQAGSVVTADVMVDRTTGRSRGFGFVEMATDEEANKAVEMWNGKELDERALKVNVAQPRSQG